MVRIIDTRSYVNREKRTIVTFIKDEYDNEFKGQSYCSVDDEFNEDFGEKEVLRRKFPVGLPGRKREHKAGRTQWRYCHAHSRQH